MGVKAKDDVYKFQPWANLARERGKIKNLHLKFSLDSKLIKHLIINDQYLLEIELSMQLTL